MSARGSRSLQGRARSVRSERGFTLLELLVGGVISLFAIGLVLLTFMGQQRSFQALDLTRDASRAERDALLELEGSLRRAGWGVDPRYAFDFSSYACSPTSTPCRDRVSAPDEMVFVARNPNYRWVDNGSGGVYSGNAWGITAASAASVTVNTKAGDLFHMGRVVLAVCANGANATMGTVAATVSTAAPVTGQVITLQAAAGDAYHANGFTSDTCFTSAGATLFLVDRYRYFITSFSGAPWLMLDTGLDLDQSGTIDANDNTPIAQGVEDMQIAYVLNVGTIYGVAAQDSNADWIVGNASGVVEEPKPGVSAPSYTTPTSDPTRFNLHPANIRSVRVTLGLRSLTQDPSQNLPWTGDPFFLAENRNAPTGAMTDNLRRFHTATSVSVHDMESRSAFIF